MTQIELKNNIEKLFIELEDRLIERQTFVRMVVLTIFSKSNMFIIGNRGVAKSHGIRLINDIIEDAGELWSLQVSKNTTKKELFGVISTDESTGKIELKISAGTLVGSVFGFPDEMFKADGEVLNGLLEFLSDKKYTIGDGKRYSSPNISTFGASNEYPIDKYMEPFVDRFDIWLEVKSIKNTQNRMKFYKKEYNQTPIQNKYFTVNDIHTIYDKALSTISIPSNIISLFTSITEHFILSGVKTSDRKYGNIINIMKVCAYLNNRQELDYSDLFVLLHTSWHNDIVYHYAMKYEAIQIDQNNLALAYC